MMKLSIKYKTFTKYLISYSIVLLIPIIIMGALMYNSFKQLLKDETNKSSKELLLSAKDSVDTRIEELDMIAIQIIYNPNLQNYKLTEKNINFVNAIRTLENIIVPNNFYSECFIYYYGNNLIYSPVGTYRVNQFINDIYIYEKWNSKQFFDDMNNINKPLVRPAENIYLLGDKDKAIRYITYAVPISYEGLNTKGTVMFIIEENKFKKIISDISKVQSGSVFIIDGNSNLITGNGSEYDQLKNFIKLNKINNDVFSEKIKLGNNYYLLSSVKSNNTGWNYISLIPMNSITSKLQPLKFKVIIGVVLVLLIGSLVVLVLTNVNYKPIKQLNKFLFKHSQQSDYTDDHHYDEMECVFRTVENMDKTINSLQIKVEKSKLKSALIELIKGYYSNMEEFNTQTLDIGLRFSKELYCVVIFMFSNGIDHKNINVIKEIESNTMPYFETYGFEGMIENQAVFIFSFDTPYEEKLSEQVKILQAFLKNNFNIRSKVCVGNSYSNISEIEASYIQASTLVEYRTIKNENNMLFYKDLKNLKEYVEYNSKEKIEKLDVYIMQGDKDKVTHTIYDIFQDIRDNDMPIFLVKSFCYNLINRVLDLAYKIDKDCNLRKSKYSDIISFMKFGNVEELCEQINGLCLYVCTLAEENKDSLNNNKLAQLVDYISKNCLDCNFSVQSMGDYFDMSVPNLSYYFKTYYKQNISDCLNQIRIEKAKNLLVETDLSVQDIVYKIGYLNASSFIRKFKHITGTTPGTYREMFRQNN